MTRLLILALLLASALAAAESPIPCRLAYLAKLHYAPVMVAQADGLFARAGLAVEPVVVGPGSGILAAEALATGAADAGAMGDGPIIISTTRDPLPVFLGVYVAAERQHRLVARPGVAVAVPADLVGKRVAVHHGSSTHAGLLLLLRKHGLAGQVTLINLNPKDMADALRAGQADLAAASDPIPDLILRKLPGTTPAGDLAGLGTDFPYGLVVARRWAEANPDGCRRLLQALEGACAAITAEPERTTALVAAVTKDTPEDTRTWMGRCQWSLRTPAAVMPGLELLAQALGEAGGLAKPARLRAAALLPR